VSHGNRDCAAQKASAPKNGPFPSDSQYFFVCTWSTAGTNLQAPRRPSGTNYGSGLNMGPASQRRAGRACERVDWSATQPACINTVQASITPAGHHALRVGVPGRRTCSAAVLLAAAATCIPLAAGCGLTAYNHDPSKCREVKLENGGGVQLDNDCCARNFPSGQCETGFRYVQGVAGCGVGVEGVFGTCCVPESPATPAPSEAPSPYWLSPPADTRAWADAKGACEAKSMQLAVIHPANISALPPLDGAEVWVGASRSANGGQFQWLDGSALPDSSTLWFVGQPDNVAWGDYIYEDCALMGVQGIYELVDFPCPEAKRYLCYGRTASSTTSTTTTTTITTTQTAVNLEAGDDAAALSVTLPYSKAEFDESTQIKYKAAVARATGTAADNVEILSITESLRRQDGNASVSVLVQTRVCNVNYAALDTVDLTANINSELSAEGLNSSIGTTAPATADTEACPGKSELPASTASSTPGV